MRIKDTKQMEIIEYLGSRDRSLISKISSDLETHSSFVFSRTIRLQEDGLLEREKNGKKLFLTLTKKGKRVSKLIHDLRRELRN